MRRADRLFEIIQLLRRANHPLTAHDIAAQLEVSERTIYRDIAVLQARRTPIEGAAGIGYILRKSYDLPPLNFDTEEIEAIVVGLALLSRTGDAGLQKAAARVARKIDATGDPATRLVVSDWGVGNGQSDRLSLLRQSIREEEVLEIAYENVAGVHSTRCVQPLAIAYFVEVNLLAAWCELRQDFRLFRIDRITSTTPQHRFFKGKSDALRTRWNATNPFSDIR